MGRGMKIVIKDPERNVKMERLKALGATTFGGTKDPCDAKTWMEVLEQCFHVMGCGEDRKLRLATFLLQGEATEWWKSVQSEITMRNSWNEFKKAFYQQYYPPSYTDANLTEFLNLVQGSMSVVQYEKKYTQLSKHATYIFKDEVDKCTRFKNGLREDIRSSVNCSPVEWREFRKLVEAALRMEKKIEKEELSGDNDIKEFTSKFSSSMKQVRGSPVSIKPQPEHPNIVQIVHQTQYLLQPTSLERHCPKSKQPIGTPHTQQKLFPNTQQQLHN